jgi:integrase
MEQTMQSKLNQPTWPKIRKRKTKVKQHTYHYWVVDCGVVDGKRITYTYKSKADAELMAQKKRIERNKIGADALRLNEDQKKEAVLAYHKLNGRATLVDAVETYLQHSPQDGVKRSVKEVFDEYLESKRKANRRPLTIRDARQKIQRFVAVYGKSLIHEITVHNIEKWIDDLSLTPVSRECYMRNLRAYFQYAVKREYIRTNPGSKIEKTHLDNKSPKVMPVDDVKKLFGVAEQSAPEFIPYLALSFFAGLRPAETQEITWDNIDLEGRIIRVIPTVAKTRRQRFVDVSENLFQWLTRYRSVDKIYYSRMAFIKVRQLAGITWSPDIARHSFGSYHLAHHENVQKTCLQMGHTMPDVLFNHYRGLVRREDAAQYWLIAPQAQSNVISPAHQ